MPSLDTAYWLRHFDRNRHDRPEPDWSAPLDVPVRLRGLLAQSLRELQLGDGGGPASLIAWNAATFRDRSPEIRAIVDRWFDEEKEHSRLLGGLLERLGATPISSHWSFRLFCSLRRSLGVSFELQILTLTELVATSYYTMLRRHCPDPAVREVCLLILRDESGHVRFQNDRLAAAGHSRPGIRGRLWSSQFWLFGAAAATVLWISHGRCLRALGANTGEFYGDVRRQIDRFLKRLDAKAREPIAATDLPPSSLDERRVDPAGAAPTELRR